MFFFHLYSLHCLFAITIGGGKKQKKHLSLVLSAKQPALLLWRLVHYTVRVLQWNVQQWSTLTQVCDLDHSNCGINQRSSLSLQRGFTNHLCVTWQVQFNAPLTSQRKGNKKNLGTETLEKHRGKTKRSLTIFRSHSCDALHVPHVTQPVLKEGRGAS